MLAASPGAKKQEDSGFLLSSDRQGTVHQLVLYGLQSSSGFADYSSVVGTYLYSYIFYGDSLVINEQIIAVTVRLCIVSLHRKPKGSSE